MARLAKWVFGLLALLGLLVVAAAVALHQWLGTGDFRARLEQESAAALGVPVALARVHLSLWPLPAVALDGVLVRTKPELTLQRVELRPDWGALLRGRREVASLVIRRAQLPQQGIDQLLAAMQKKKQAVPGPKAPEPESPQELDWLLRRVVLDEVTWRNPRGVATTVDGEARLADDSLPEKLNMQVTEGAWKGARLKLQREGDRFAVDAQVGGGTVQGHVQYRLPTTPPSREREIKGQLETRGVDVTALAASGAGTRGPLGGRLEASTTLSARAATAAGLADALQTQTRFTVRNAVVHGIDLAKAVTTVGLSRGGETRLDVLTGQLNTQGRAAQLSDLVASSGVLRATGKVALAPSRALSGRVLVDVTAGAAGSLVGVPLVLGGTLDAPEVTLSRSAMLGAAIGTAVMPGVGTGAGARAGDGVGEGLKKLFGK